MNMSIAAVIAETEERLSLDLTEEQRDTAWFMLNNFVAGMAAGRGTGKTFLMKFLVECDKTLDAHRDMETL